MTDQELRKLRRQDLLHLLLETEQENRQLRELLEESREQLNSKEIAISESGNLAEAALKLSGLFEDAQKAADLYRHNVEDACQEKENECLARCEEIKAEAKKWAEDYKESAKTKLRIYLKKHPELIGAFKKNAEEQKTDSTER